MRHFLRHDTTSVNSFHLRWKTLCVFFGESFSFPSILRRTQLSDEMKNSRRSELCSNHIFFSLYRVQQTRKLAAIAIVQESRKFPTFFLASSYDWVRASARLFRWNFVFSFREWKMLFFLPHRRTRNMCLVFMLSRISRSSRSCAACHSPINGCVFLFNFPALELHLKFAQFELHTAWPWAAAAREILSSCAQKKS